MGRYYYSIVLLLSVGVVGAASIKLTGWTTNSDPALARSALGVGTGGTTLWTSSGTILYPSGSTGTNDGWIATSTMIYPE